MTRTLTTTMLALSLAALGACSRPPEPPTQNRPDPQAAATVARTATPVDDLLRARDRAASVQDTVDAQADAQRAAIDEQGR